MADVKLDSLNLLANYADKTGRWEKPTESANTESILKKLIFPKVIENMRSKCLHVLSLIRFIEESFVANP